MNDSAPSGESSTSENEIGPAACDEIKDCETLSSSDSSFDDIGPLLKRLKITSESGTGDQLPPLPTVGRRDDSSSSEDAKTFTSRSGQVWRQSVKSSGAGRLPKQNLFRANEGITTKARANVSDSSKQSAFSLLIDEKMLRHIRKRTETEANRVLGKTDWSLSLDEVEKFIGLCYLRGVFGGKSLPLHRFWSNEFRLPIFKETICPEITSLKL